MTGQVEPCNPPIRLFEGLGFYSAQDIGAHSPHGIAGGIEGTWHKRLSAGAKPRRQTRQVKHPRRRWSLALEPSSLRAQAIEHRLVKPLLLTVVHRADKEIKGSHLRVRDPVGPRG